MAYSEHLADRVRQVLRNERGITEKRMFGGLAILHHGRLLVGIYTDGLLARLGPEAAAEALRSPHVEPFINAGRTMSSWVIVDAAALEGEASLRERVGQALVFVETLPPK